METEKIIIRPIFKDELQVCEKCGNSMWHGTCFLCGMEEYLKTEGKGLEYVYEEAMANKILAENEDKSECSHCENMETAGIDTSCDEAEADEPYDVEWAKVQASNAAEQRANSNPLLMTMKKLKDKDYRKKYLNKMLLLIGSDKSSDHVKDMNLENVMNMKPVFNREGWTENEDCYAASNINPNVEEANLRIRNSIARSISDDENADNSFTCSKCGKEFEVKGDSKFKSMWILFEAHVKAEHPEAEIDPELYEFMRS